MFRRGFLGSLFASAASLFAVDEKRSPAGCQLPNDDGALDRVREVVDNSVGRQERDQGHGYVVISDVQDEHLGRAILSLAARVRDLEMHVSGE